MLLSINEKLRIKSEEIIRNANRILETTEGNNISLTILNNFYLDFQRGLSLGCSEESLIRLAKNLIAHKALTVVPEGIKAEMEIKSNLQNYLDSKQTISLK